ncbi:MAG: FadR/GntR family transcriptional regulator [Geminicoccaceae bacterium]
MSGGSAGGQALHRLRRAIESGAYPLHGRLPPERELSVDLGVGRSTLRKALAVLEAEGLIWRHVGRGTFVGSRPVDPAAGLSLVAKPGSPAEDMEVRLMFEPLMAGLAAVRASPAEIAYMRRCLLKSKAAPDWQTYELWDSTLHRAIAAATHNALMLAFLEAINALRQQDDWRQLRSASLTPDNQRLYSEQQHAIVDGIAARDSRAAAAAMRRHLSSVQTTLFDASDAAPEEGTTDTLGSSLPGS